MNGFTKLHQSIVTSTIWRAPDHVRLVWITLLALSDQHGEVAASVPGLAAVANVTVEACEAAIQALCGPDKYSRTRDHDGRRIEECDGGWRLLNHAKYRRLASADDRLAKDAERKRRERANKAKHMDASADVRNSPQASAMSRQAEAEAEAEANAETEAKAEAVSEQRPPELETADWVFVERLAQERGWVGTVKASDRMERSVVRLIEQAKKTGGNKTPWRKVYALVFAAWIDAKDSRINLRDWPTRLLEDWHECVLAVDAQKAQAAQ